ncbi:uncharacterized protein LOC121794573 isoform X1 [Salvia splendens]|uniref:uncharacterized protein LOC121794573 isoform X1 n=1 Tax=Salvia splendens TaxID=180675 RepID=UPI001C279302|nr:uncharacterized protein LOC121794573 isoform X1 [Salvia splendens]
MEFINNPLYLSLSLSSVIPAFDIFHPSIILLRVYIYKHTREGRERKRQDSLLVSLFSFCEKMARELGFWLPSEILTDDDLLTDFKPDDFSYGFGNSLGFNSDLSSPAELVTETESEDDDLLLSDLTRKLSQSSLLSDYASKGWKVCGSPQSTLCGCKPSPAVSPNSVHGFCSPPDAEDYMRQDFLHAAAEEVARMRMVEETAAFYSSKHFPAQVKPRTGASPAPQIFPNSASGFFYPNKAGSQPYLSSQLLQAAKMKKNGEYMNGIAEFQLRNRRGNVGDGRTQVTPMATWPGLHQTGSGMRPAYRAEPGLKKERTGTGVFLPQRFGSLPAENRKKSVPTNVLVPEKVFHAWNINVDAIDAQLHRNARDYGSSNFDLDAALKHRKILMMAQQRRSLAAQPAMNQQLRLPRDWTY